MDIKMAAETVSHAQETLEGCPGTELYFWMHPSQIKSVEEKKNSKNVRKQKFQQFLWRNKQTKKKIANLPSQIAAETEAD